MEEYNKYVIRIYNVTTNELPLDNWTSEGLEEYQPLITELASTKKELLKAWSMLLKQYEGWAYTVFDIANNNCLVGGVFDPWDEEIIKEYLG